MKFYQRRSFALVVLILAVALSSVYGISKKPASLPDVSYHHWIWDESDLLDSEAEQTIKSYNAAWDRDYSAVVAVAAVETKDLRGWKMEKFAKELGEKWGLGANDMILILVRGDDYYVDRGERAAGLMMDTQQAKLRTAIEKDYYDGDYSAAAVAFFRQADIFYAQAMGK